MQKFLALCLTCLSLFSEVSGQTQARNFPNPATSPRECNLRGKGFICDPDSVLSPDEREMLSKNILLKRVYQGTQNVHGTSSKCIKKGLTVVIAVARKIPSRGQRATEDEMLAWTRAVQSKWNLEPECKKDVVIGFSENDRLMKAVSDGRYTGITSSVIGRYFNDIKSLLGSKPAKAFEVMALGFADTYKRTRNLGDASRRGSGGGSMSGGGSGSRGLNDLSKKMKEFKMPALSSGLIAFAVVVIACCLCCCCLCYCCKQLRQSFCPCCNKGDGEARGGMGKMGNFSLPAGMASRIPSSLFGGRMGSNRMGQYGGGGMGMSGMGMGAAAGAGAGYLAGRSGGGETL